MALKQLKQGKKLAKTVIKTAVLFIAVIVICGGFFAIRRFANERKVLHEIIARLKADSRIAEVLVTSVNTAQETDKELTTIKFLEYDINGKPLQPRYFTFPGNIIQFQSLVIRFNDDFVCRGDKLRGRSVYLFWKVFMLAGAHTKEYEITRMDEVPYGYKIDGVKNKFELQLWRKFWRYALGGKEARLENIKNAQIEAPGTRFIPGVLYTLKIEHDGGIRIDAQPLSPILEGESIPRKEN